MQELDPESIVIGPGFGLVLLLQEKITIAVIQNIIEREIQVLHKRELLIQIYIPRKYDFKYHHNICWIVIDYHQF